MLPEFRNEPLTDFSLEPNRAAFQAALEKVSRELGRRYPLVIDGARIERDAAVDSLDPCDPSVVVGSVARAGREDAERALRGAAAAYESWSRTAPEARARVLFRAAAIMRRRKHELSAWMVREVAKSWVEADADTAEAIDFLEFYGREMLRLAAPQPLTRIPGEDNELTYLPLGVGAVIPPWNFPLAIMAGMTVASVVAGNTVCLKPAHTSAVIAAKFVEVMEEAGTPPGVIQFVPGPGAEVGEHLVDHPLTRFIAFTGSKETGLRIHERAARTQPGQRWIKRTILEMGGKDAIVVDEGVDVDDAARGIVQSAFGFQGQKCSACSRAIVHEAVYDRVLEAVLASTSAIVRGPAKDPRVDMSAVVDDKQLAKVLEYIEVGRREGRLVHGGRRDAALGEGYFVEPTVFADVAPRARIAQEEIFGPVLAVHRVASFEEGIALANDTEFGLTGAAYSRSRARLEHARREFFVGNLYLNRKCTGALVGAHPFGGFHMSGTDSKAGGRDYLLLFTQAKVVSERM
jgi:1-pyrroline-5-carboxylate dehydrogenase